MAENKTNTGTEMRIGKNVRTGDGAMVSQERDRAREGVMQSSGGKGNLWKQGTRWSQENRWKKGGEQKRGAGRKIVAPKTSTICTI